jgi:hypothetical protein
MTIKIELGFTASGVGGPFFTLNDPVAGVLDSPDWVLGGGEALVDVTAFARRVAIDRGKSRELDRYQSGRASVEFNNSDRTFDPTFTASPFFGQIVPRRQIRITLDGEIAFEGIVDDWNLNYDPSGFSFASCNAFDAFSALANIVLSEPDEDYDDFPEQTTGDRINEVLNFIGWNDEREIDSGASLLYDSLVPFGQNVLQYLQLVADSEPGDLFIGKQGQVIFKSRNNQGGEILTLADDGSGITFGGISVVFGVEQLYNSVTASNELDTVTARDELSINTYGERDLNVTTLLAQESDLQQYAEWLLLNYKEPEYRFETLQINLQSKTPAEREALLKLEIGDPILVKFTPGGIGDQILRASKCIGIGHARDPQSETITVKLQTYALAPFILDDDLFGRLNDVGTLSW